MAEHGMVRSQVVIMFPANPHLTAERPLVVPTPIMAPAIVCVVLTGMPDMVAQYKVTAPAVSAAKPPTGFRCVILDPMVLTIFQPPASVPMAIIK